jgi:dihydroflavonol-4-reductase
MSSFWSGKGVCVTGGSGFLGFHLVKQLLERGAAVRVLALAPRPTHPLWGMAEVDKRFGDLLDTEHVRASVAGSDVIFHTAGIVAVSGPGLARMHAVHVDGTRNVLATAPPAARIVHTSSIVAVGASRAREVLDEDSPFDLDRLKVDYVHAKRAAEEAALAAAAGGRHVVVVNPGYMVGPEDHEPSVMGRLCARFWSGRVPLALPGGYNLVDVRDAAAGHLLAAEHGRPGRRYILGGENCGLRDMFVQLARAASLRPRALPRLPYWSLHVLAAAKHLRAGWKGKEPYPSFQAVRMLRFFWFHRSDRAMRELGYATRPLARTLADAYAWYVVNGGGKPRGLKRWWLRPPA